MFGNLFGRKRKTPAEDSWSVATTQDGDMPLILRIRNLSPDLDKRAFPHMIAVSWPYQPGDQGGMPSQDDKQRMDLLEDLLTPALEETQQAILTVVVTGNGVREWQWYSRSVEDTMEIVNTALASQSPFPVEFSVQDDPEWEAYRQFQQ